MPLKIKQVQIRERDELEPLLVRDPGIIEEGLRVISHQLQTDTGPLDILAVDTQGRLVVVELKSEAAESHLDQGLRYYDWVRQNLGWIAGAFKDFNIEPKSLPKLCLIAPSFTDNVVQIAKYVNVDLQLLEYHAVEDEKGERGLICTALDFGPPIEPPQLMTIEDKAKWFADDRLRDLFKTILSELAEAGYEVKPIGGLEVTIWHKGKRFIWMAARRKFFTVNVLTPADNWGGAQSIASRKAWDEYWTNQAIPYVQYLDSGDAA